MTCGIRKAQADNFLAAANLLLHALQKDTCLRDLNRQYHAALESGGSAAVPHSLVKIVHDHLKREEL